MKYDKNNKLFEEKCTTVRLSKDSRALLELIKDRYNVGSIWVAADNAIREVFNMHTGEHIEYIKEKTEKKQKCKTKNL